MSRVELEDGASFDFIVVGAGSAGCAVAARLAEQAGVSVLLLEAGGSARSWKFRVPGAQSLVSDWVPYAWLLETEPDPSRNGRVETWRRGRMLGGSSAINGLIYAIGLPRDYERWVSLGATGWSWAEVEPYFRRAERCPGLPGRGQSGPTHVEIFRSPHALTHDLLSAFAAAGVSLRDDVNRITGEGIGIAQTNQRRGLRQDSATAYLHLPPRRGALRVVTGATVERICIDSGEARGVMLRRGGQTLRVHARREVVLSAGAFGSPQILMLSGIGPGEHLRHMGIPVQVDLPGVGANLHDHPELYIEYEVRERTYSSALRWHRMLASALEFALTRRGQATSCATHVLGYARSQPAEPEPDLLLFGGPWGYLEDVLAFSGEANVYSLSPSVCHPRSRGRVVLRSAEPAAPPCITPNLLGDAEDVARLVRGVRLLDHVANAEPFRRHVLRRRSPTCDPDDEIALEAFVRETAGICYHACGTCRMGSDGAAVVDPQLRVRGVGRLRVADASVIPLITSGNLHAPTLMIGERAADFLRAQAS